MKQFKIDGEVKCSPASLKAFRDTLMLLGIRPERILRDPPLLSRQSFQLCWKIRNQLLYPNIYGPRLYLPLFQAKDEPNAILLYGGKNRIMQRRGNSVLCDVFMVESHNGSAEAFLSYAPCTFEKGNPIFITDDILNYLKALYYFHCQRKRITSVLAAGNVPVALKLLNTYGWDTPEVLWNFKDASWIENNKNLQILQCTKRWNHHFFNRGD